MLTSKLEDLIWKGQAFPKTFCVGNTQKHVLNIEQDRFIIITDLLYFPFYAQEQREGRTEYRAINKWITSNHISTQLTILGEKNFNRFQFRNNINFVQEFYDTDSWLAIPQTPTHLDTYLIHTTGVSFTFSFGKAFNNLNAIVNPDSTAYAPPVDYGKDGDSGAIAVTEIGDMTTTDFTFTNYYNRTSIPANFPATQELAYSVDNETNISSNYREFGNAHPILQVSYIEILGQPNNVGL